MQRPRPGLTGINKSKDPAWSGIINPQSFNDNRGNMSISDLEGRVATTEYTNKQILSDLSDLKYEIQRMSGRDALKATKFPDHAIDSDASFFQGTPKHWGLSKHNLKSPDKTPVELLNIFNRLGETDRVLQKISADVQTINARCGSQGVDIQNLYQELKNVDTKYESIIPSEAVLHSVQNDGRTDGTPTSNPFIQNASAMSNKLKLLQVSVDQLERKLEQAVSERLRFENNIHSSISEQSNRLLDAEKISKNALVEVRSEVRTNAQELISQRQNFQSELESMISKVNNRVSVGFKKMQDDILSLKGEIESTICRLSTTENPTERQITELETYVKKMDKHLTTEMADLKDDQKGNQKKLLASLSQLDLAVESLEQGLSDEKEQLRVVIAAEIKARTSNISSMQSRLHELDRSVGDIASKVHSVVGDLQQRLACLEAKIDRVNDRGPTEGSARDCAQKIQDLEDDITELRKNSQRESQEVQGDLTNIAEAVQAVKAALLKKIEMTEKETKLALEKLAIEISELRPKSSNDEA